MGTETIYGSWNAPPANLPEHEKELMDLWHSLAIQNEGQPNYEANNSMTQRKNEFIELAQIFRRVNPRVIAEIGLAQGGTIAAWARLARPDARFITIDRDPNDCRPRPGDPINPAIYRGRLAMTEQGGGVYHLMRPGQRVSVIRGWTYDPEAKRQFLEALGGRKIDFMFHDASHQAEMFHADFEWMWPLIEEGGVLASHDIMPSVVPGITKSVEWERIRKEETYSALYEWRGSRDGDSFGIGAIIK